MYVCWFGWFDLIPNRKTLQQNCWLMNKEHTGTLITHSTMRHQIDKFNDVSLSVCVCALWQCSETKSPQILCLKAYSSSIHCNEMLWLLRLILPLCFSFIIIQIRMITHFGSVLFFLNMYFRIFVDQSRIECTQIDTLTFTLYFNCCTNQPAHQPAFVLHTKQTTDLVYLAHVWLSLYFALTKISERTKSNARTMIIKTMEICKNNVYEYQQYGWVDFSSTTVINSLNATIVDFFRFFFFLLLSGSKVRNGTKLHKNIYSRTQMHSRMHTHTHRFYEGTFPTTHANIYMRSLARC